MLHKIATNDCKVEVTVEKRWIGERSAREEYRKCEIMVDEIKRHVDDVGHVFIEQKYVWTDDRGYEWDSLYEALEELYDEEGVRETYTLRYERPSDDGIGTRSTVNSFEKLIEAAWQTPWNFEYITGPVLTASQRIFLSRVIDESLKLKGVAV